MESTERGEHHRHHHRRHRKKRRVYVPQTQAEQRDGPTVTQVLIAIAVFLTLVGISVKVIFFW